MTQKLRLSLVQLTVATSIASCNHQKLFRRQSAQHPGKQRMGRQCAACILLLLAAVVGAQDAGQDLAEQQYSRAVEIRSREDASNKQLRQAAAMLREAAGVRLDLSSVSPPANVTDLLHQQAQSSVLTRKYPGLEISDVGNMEALKELAIAYDLGEGVLFNPAVGFELLRTAAERGDAEAQAYLGFRLAMGIYPPLPGVRESIPLFELGEEMWPEALVHYFFAASGNDSFARMALGYRHMQGLGVPRSCQTAVLYYQPVAEEVVELAQTPDSLPFVEPLRLSAHAQWKGQPTREQQQLHYQWFADLGSTEAKRALGQILTQGAHRDPVSALRYFRQAADAGDAPAMAHLGHMYANGVGVEASNTTALEWFKRGAEKSHPSALYGLGYAYLGGFGVPKDAKKAFKYFTAAGELMHVDSWFHLGVMHLNGLGVKKNLQQALNYFTSAAKYGHVLAQYNLAMLHLQNSGTEKNGCMVALGLLKKVAERGPMAGVLQDALEWYRMGDYEEAVVAYIRAAEIGMEIGQSNAAWMLSRGYGAQGPAAATLAMKLHQRAAGQGNVDALLQLGDSHWYGRGVNRSWSTAAQLYQAASKFGNAQALFNLGLMHEYGAGLPQDLHLAKRYYDKSMDAQKDAHIPVRLALASLALHAWWDLVKLHLPAALSWLKSHLYTLAEPAPGSAGFATGVVHKQDRMGLGLGWLEQAVDAAAGSWNSSEPGLSSTTENIILLALFALLSLVLWRRRTLRTAQQRAPHVVRVVRAGPFRPAGVGQREQQAAEPAAAAGSGSGNAGGDGSAAVRQDELNGQPQEGSVAGDSEHPERERQEGAEAAQEPGQ